jgi:predicted metal-dependent peptidase
MEKQEARLKKSHVFLLKHPKVHQLGGIILMGTNEVVKGIPTAYTDGVNKRYGEEFLAKLKDEEINGLVLHENCHIFYRHVTHHKTTFKENAKLANIAADFVVNDMIVEMKDAKIVLPEGGLYNPMFHNWSMSKVYAYLKQRKKELDEEGQGQGQGQGGQPQDNNSPGGETLNDRHGVTDIDKLLKNLNDHDSLDEHDWFLSATRSCPRKYASCGGTPKSMANKSFKTTTQVLLTCSSPWVVGELAFHVSVNT